MSAFTDRQTADLVLGAAAEGEQGSAERDRRMSDWQRVTVALFRIYRPIAAWFLGMVVVVVTVASVIFSHVSPQSVSLWLIIVGFGSKYWLGIVAVMLISMQLRSFVANGISRRAFLAGAGVFSLLAALFFALLGPIGHAVEYVLLSLFVDLPAGYPAVSVSGAIGEFGHALPANLAFLVTGAAVTAGFYRFGGLLGLAVMIPALVPISVAESLFNFNDGAEVTTRFMPYAVALLLSLAATAAGAVLLRFQVRDVAIRRTAS